ncbi:MAG: RsmE family RNA methyltransferase [Lachnospiraceae bacterium]|nr:RsmE family RNA methyltransferase [Lachnospiraceae bacterium]
MPKFFVPEREINENRVIIKGEDENHIKNVLRFLVGDAITLCDGNGFDYEGIILGFSKGGVLVDIKSKNVSLSEPKTRVTLFQGMPKGEKTESIIQKCVELGVYEIVLVSMHRSVAKLKADKEEAKLSRYMKLSYSAAKQSGRGIVPKVYALSYEEALKYARGLDLTFVAYENEEKVSLKDVLKGFSGSSIGVFIGPEGGFEDFEIEMAECFKTVSLGKRILRTETAGPAVLAVINYELG